MTAASRKLQPWKLHVASQSGTSDVSIECVASAHLKHQRLVLRLDLIPVHGKACAWLGRITAGCGLEGSLSNQDPSTIAAQSSTQADTSRLVCNGSRIDVPCHAMMHNVMCEILCVDAS